MDELREALEDLFDDGLSDEEVLDMWNEYAYSHNRPMMYEMYRIEEVLINQEHMALREIISSLDPKFDTEDEYFTVNDMDYIVSFSDWYSVECPFDREELIDSIVDTANSFGNDQVQDLLDEYGE